MQSLGHPVTPEQQNTQKCRFKEERGDHFITEHRSQEVGCRVGIVTPVSTELEGHDDARDDTHAKDDGKHLYPKFGQALPNGVTGFEGKRFQKGNKRSQANTENWKDRVKRHHKCKLQT